MLMAGNSFGNIHFCASGDATPGASRERTLLFGKSDYLGHGTKAKNPHIGTRTFDGFPSTDLHIQSATCRTHTTRWMRGPHP
jgi:hypothetical protein